MSPREFAWLFSPLLLTKNSTFQFNFLLTNLGSIIHFPLEACLWGLSSPDLRGTVGREAGRVHKASRSSGHALGLWARRWALSFSQMWSPFPVKAGCNIFSLLHFLGEAQATKRVKVFFYPRNKDNATGI